MASLIAGRDLLTTRFFVSFVALLGIRLSRRYAIAIQIPSPEEFTTFSALCSIIYTDYGFQLYLHMRQRSHRSPDTDCAAAE